MKWTNDSLGIYFAHMKNDQFGERPRDPRHIYANPLIPEICPILSLGLYLLTNPIDSNVPQLFPGGNQYDRFRRVLMRLLQSEDGKRELESRGMVAEDIGTHSMRKGSATYASSGSTSCPSSTSIHLRAGWALGGVQDTYLRYEAAGDMYVGRTVSGLPTSQASFAILPPHFKERTELVADMIRICFPNLPSNANYMAEFVLASIIYHHTFLENTLPSHHRLFYSPLFRDRSALEKLKNLVECRLNLPGDSMVATGIPPHIALLQQMQSLSSSFTAVIPALNRVSSEVVDGVVQVIETRAIGAGTVTRDGLETLLNSCLERTGIMTLIDTIRNPSNPTSTTVSSNQANSSITNRAHMWGGRFHLVPENFTFLDAACLVAWQYWICGDRGKELPPLRNLSPDDMSTKDLKKRLSDFKYLMGLLEREAREKGLWKNDATVQEAIDMFESCKENVLNLEGKSENNRRRRPEQIKWTTMVHLVRKKQRTRKN